VTQLNLAEAGMETLWQDLKFGGRMLAKGPGFTLVAVITLALGIGANTAIFSVVEAVLLRPLPYSDPDDLMIVWEANLKRNRMTNVAGPANYIRWRERNQSFEHLAAFAQWTANVTGVGEPERVPLGYVTADFFQTLGVRAALGRALAPDDGRPDSPDVVVLSHSYWNRKFGSDPQIIGKTLSLNGQPQTIVGVMPADFRALMVVDVFAPMAIREEFRTARGRWMVVVGRAKPGVTRDQAQAEMAGIAKQIETELPDFTGGWTVNVVPVREQLTGSIRNALLVLAGAVGFVLLIACANVANLFLARATDRQREFAVRRAMGAPRSRLIRQLLTEGVLLGLLGGTAGALLGVWAVAGMQALLPADLARFTEVRVNPEVLLFTLGVALLTGLIFGSGPAFSASRTALSETLKEGGRSGTGAARSKLRGALVVAEVMLSVMLLVGAGLLLRSFAALQSVNPGFDASHVLTFQIDLPGRKYAEPAQVVQFFGQLQERLRQLPGVRGVGAISWLPLGGRGSATSLRLPDRPVPPPGQEPGADVRMVTPTLFETLRIPLLRGRGITPQDTDKTPKVVVINETMAKQHWPGEDPVGKRVFMSWGEEIEAQVVGVVGDVHLTSLETDPRATLYWPLAQLENDFMTVMVRSEQDPRLLATAIKRQVAALDPELPAAKMQPLAEVVSASVNEPRFTATLLGLFASVALMLAAVGIYGVLAYSVAQRTHEIGIRMALGAHPADIVGMVLRQGMGQTALGVAVGLAGSFALTGAIEKLLFKIEATDPITFAGVVLVLAAAALLACYIPAQRATKVDPMVALRYE